MKDFLYIALPSFSFKINQKEEKQLLHNEATGEETLVQVVFSIGHKSILELQGRFTKITKQLLYFFKFFIIFDTPVFLIAGIVADSAAMHNTVATKEVT